VRSLRCRRGQCLGPGSRNGGAAHKTICEQVQLEAFQSIPFMPNGQWHYPWAIRKGLTDFVKCVNVLLWGVGPCLIGTTDGVRCH